MTYQFTLFGGMVWTCPTLRRSGSFFPLFTMEIARYTAKTTLIGGISALYWYLFLVLLMGWYQAEFHILATVATVVMAYLGNTGGILGGMI